MPSSQPVLFVSHGSPLTALNPGDLGLVWEKQSRLLRQPTAIVVVSAHWTTRIPLLTAGARPATIHDFRGFPQDLYQIRYPAMGSPEWAEAIRVRLELAGIPAGLDVERGLDHGVWVPLLHLFPLADVPVIELSVQPEQDARHHLRLGRALAGLKKENVLIIGSGHLTHNLKVWNRARGGQPDKPSQLFRDWVHQEILGAREDSLVDWLQAAPHASHAHPTPEHFLPLLVAMGAAERGSTPQALGGGWIDGVLAADNYRWDS